MELRVRKLHPEAKLPEKNNDSDSGYDLFIVKDDHWQGECLCGVPVGTHYTLQAGERKLFSTGIALELPENYGMLIRDRSGMAVKDGIHTLAGVIDNGYRGEVKICIVNLSNKACTFLQGQKVAQGILHLVPNCDIKEIEELSTTERGEQGFGSSGK